MKAYKFVREELSVLSHRGLVEHPAPKGIKGKVISNREKKAISTWVGIIYKSLRGRKLGRIVIGTLTEGLDIIEKQN